MKTVIFSVMAIALSACDTQPSGAPSNEADSTTTTSVATENATAKPEPVEQATVKPTPTATASPSSQTRQCELTVDGTSYVKGPCLVYPTGDGYTLNSWDNGKPKQSHFAVVNADSPSRGVAYWNSDPDDTKANDLLGDVTKEGACWVNKRARICVE